MTSDNEAISMIPDFPAISAPMGLGEIVAEYNSHEYNTEMLLQHLLLWVKRNCGARGVEAVAEIHQLQNKFGGVK